jgi:arylsulfatase A-like enzyme
MSTDKKPNILFILIDDMGWRDIACNGSSFYETPNIDRIAADGIRFTDAYAACPVCSPTRASILSGKYPARVGVTDWIDHSGHCHPRRGRLIDAPYIDHLPACETSLATALKEGGYQTWHVGKWHLGGPDNYPENHGFDVNVGGDHHGCPRHGYFSPWIIGGLDEFGAPDGTYLTDFITDQALDLIKNSQDEPFYLNMCYFSVHTPIQAKPEKIEKYQKKINDLGLDQVNAIEEGELMPWEGDNGGNNGARVMRRVVQSDPVYAAMIESLDENIGRLLAALEEAGKAEDTVVVFTSDNGGLSTAEGSPTCNAPLSEGKGWMYEGGTREPLLVKWPGVTAPGSTCSIPVTSPDFYPTLLEIAGLTLRPEQHMDGVSLVPLLQGGDSLDREAIYWHYPHYGNQGGTPGSSIRSGDWKLIEFFEDGRLELYNLRDDIGEDNDRAESEPEIRNRLHNLLLAWRKECEAKYPAINPDYIPWGDPLE